MPLKLGQGIGLPFGQRLAAFDPKSGNPRHYFDFKHGLSMFNTDVGGTVPVSTDLDPVNYVQPQMGSEPLVGQNSGLQYRASVNLGAYSGPALYSGHTSNPSLRGVNSYGAEETFLLYFYGAGWGAGLKSICGKTGNSGQLFYNGDTITLSLFNGSGAFTSTGKNVAGGPALLALRHHGDGKTSFSVNQGSYFETYAAGSGVFGKAEFAHAGGAGFGTGAFYYIAGAYFNYIVPDNVRDAYFAYWSS
ncbi:MAG: hypothetical protein BGO01_08735 [Armatimonadetes bacterium 55-13]|mgnify:FL=1|nr:hypothetical protein [Armatimonadota bacterium]OJU61947.1 MAG: hypothetical protein BGO01_08735 [Armatimonadetes bacterium 55-13]